MNLRPSTAQDLPELADIHAEAFDAPWKAEEIATLMAGPGGFGFLAEEADGMCGFIICRRAADEAEVLTLATRVSRRRRGVGAALLQAAMSSAKADGARMLFLEVAADNPAALALYHGHGFAPVGRRPGYYARAGVDAAAALVLRLDLNR